MRFIEFLHLVEELEQALHVGKLKQFRNKLEKIDLMILDEMGYLPFAKKERSYFFKLFQSFMNKRV